MFAFKRSLVSLLLLSVVLSVTTSFVKAENNRDFELISNVPQDVSSLRFPSKCPKFGKVTKVMYTIEPSDDDQVRVSTYPADLVSAKKENNGLLQLEFNEDVAYGSSEGGVQIFFPSSQLKDVTVAADSIAQIFDGFTNINSLRVSSDAQLYATMLSSSDGDASSDNKLSSLSVSSDAKAVVLSNYNITKVSVSSDGELTLQSPMANEVSVSSDAILKMNGNIASARVSSDGKFTLEGNVFGSRNIKVSSDGGVTVYGTVSSSTTIRVSSDGKFNLGGSNLKSSVEATSDGQVRAPNCDTVTTRSDGKCIVDNNIQSNVDVVVDTLPLTRKGTTHCGNFNWWSSSWKGKFWSLFGIAVFLSSFYICYRYCCRKNCHDKEGNNKYGGAITTPTVQVADAYVIDDGTQPQKVQPSKDKDTLPENKQKHDVEIVVTPENKV